MWICLECGLKQLQPFIGATVILTGLWQYDLQHLNGHKAIVVGLPANSRWFSISDEKSFVDVEVNNTKYHLRKSNVIIHFYIIIYF